MEERILYPTAMKKLNDGHWVEIRQGEAEIGYAWTTPGDLWDPSVVIAKNAVSNLGKAIDALDSAPVPDIPAGEQKDNAIPLVPLDVGKLRFHEINLLLKNLPLDITYVDKDDKVLYYSQGIERIFPRSPAIIGRSVQKCHPPKSVHIVEQIVEAFKKKEKASADFWLNMNEHLIYIRYFALFDENGDYAGVIEVSQDITDIQKIKGEQRLLDWNQS